MTPEMRVVVFNPNISRIASRRREIPVEERCAAKARQLAADYPHIAGDLEKELDIMLREFSG